jgi:hypothetical protein
MGPGWRALAVETLTIAPPPRSSITGIAARTARTTANRLKSNISRQSASVSGRKEKRGRDTPGGGPPALLTRTSRPPKTSTAWATAAAGASGSERSTGTCTRFVPTSASSSGVLLREATTTRAPSSCNVRAVARPMPLLPPVTRAILPVRFSSTPTRLGHGGHPVRRESDPA